MTSLADVVRPTVWSLNALGVLAAEPVERADMARKHACTPVVADRFASGMTRRNARCHFLGCCMHRRRGLRNEICSRQDGIACCFLSWLLTPLIFSGSLIISGTVHVRRRFICAARIKYNILNIYYYLFIIIYIIYSLFRQRLYITLERKRTCVDTEITLDSFHILQKCQFV